MDNPFRWTVYRLCNVGGALEWIPACHPTSIDLAAEALQREAVRHPAPELDIDGELHTMTLRVEMSISGKPGSTFLREDMTSGCALGFAESMRSTARMGLPRAVVEILERVSTDEQDSKMRRLQAENEADRESDRKRRKP